MMQRRHTRVPGEQHSAPPPPDPDPSSVQVICVDRFQTGGLAEEVTQLASDILNEAVVTCC